MYSPLSLRVASMCTGIAGFDVGLAATGHHIVLQVERDAACRNHLERVFARVPRHGDINTFPRLLKNIDLAVIGFPCTDISHCGKQVGITGPDSGIVFKFLHLVEQSNAAGHAVPFLLLENVEALLNKRAMDGGYAEADIVHIVDRLESMGYSWAYRTIDAAGFGLPNHRRRVFIVAALHADPRAILLAQGRDPCAGECGDRPCVRCLAVRRIWMAAARRRGSASSSNTCAHCGTPSCRHCDVVCFDSGNAQAKPSVAVAPCIKTGNTSMYVVSPAVGVGRLLPKHAARLLGFPPHTDYTWHQLGNAVSVRAVAWIRESLANVSMSKFEADERDVPLDVWRQKNARRGRRGGDTTTTPLCPRAAWCLKGGVRHASSACAEPVKTPLLPLIDVVRDGLDPVKTDTIVSYMHRLAARGMRYDDLLRVAAPSGLVLPDGMDPDSLLAAGVPGVWRPDKLGRVVWARTGAGAWWPAEIVDPSARPLPPAPLAGRLRAAAPSTAPPPPSSTRNRCNPRPPTRAAPADAPPAIRAAPRLTRRAVAVQAAARAESDISGCCTGPPPSSTAAVAAVAVRPAHFVSFFAGADGPAPPARWACDGDTLDWQSSHPTTGQPPPRSNASLACAVAVADAVARSQAAGWKPAPGLRAQIGTAVRHEPAYPPCKACVACAQHFATCFRVDVAAAARCGHVGAQLASLEGGAVGACVDVWCADTASWERGVIAGFDKNTFSHTVALDGACGVPDAGRCHAIKLWHLSRVVRLASDRWAWAEAASRAAASAADAATPRRAAATADCPPLKRRPQADCDRDDPSDMRDRSRRRSAAPAGRSTASPPPAQPRSRSHASSTTAKKQHRQWGASLLAACKLLTYFAAVDGPPDWRRATCKRVGGMTSKAALRAWKKRFRWCYVRHVTGVRQDECVEFVLGAVGAGVQRWVEAAFQRFVDVAVKNTRMHT